MHAFMRPSQKLRYKVRAATLRSLHHISLYKRLILLAKYKGARIAETGTALHIRLVENPAGGTNLLKFAYDQLYNGKLALRYRHVPTHECPLCHLPDSCTHIAGKFKAHKNLTISRHNAACQLVHTAIRNAAKGGGALYNAIHFSERKQTLGPYHKPPRRMRRLSRPPPPPMMSTTNRYSLTPKRTGSPPSPQWRIFDVDDM